MAAKSLFRLRSPAVILPVCFRTNWAILFPLACHTIFGRAKIKQETQQPNMRRIVPSRRNAYSRTQCTRRMPGWRRPKLYCNIFPNQIKEEPSFPPRPTTRRFATTKERSELTPTQVGARSPRTTPLTTSFRTIHTPRDKGAPTSPDLTPHHRGGL